MNQTDYNSCYFYKLTRSWLADWFTGARSKEGTAIPIAPSLYSLSNKMGNSLLAVRDINHKYIVVGGKKFYETEKGNDSIRYCLYIEHNDYRMRFRF